MRLSLESGYGSQSCSLEDCDILHEVVATSEIDADAIIAYAAIRFDKEDLIKKPENITDEEIAKWLIDRNIGYDFKQSKSKVHSWLKKKDKTYLYTVYNSAVLSNELGDISLIDTKDIPNHDLLTMSSPCQDFSVAGKQEGGSWKCLDCDKEFNPIESNFLEECPHCKSKNIKKTRSSLLFECAKVIRSKTPKYILLENVKNLVGKQHIETFNKWCEWLENQGYTNTYKVINGKDYNIPQNRERVFMISILGDEKFEFAPVPCTSVRLRDILEDEVDEKYYINKPFTFIDKKNEIATLEIKGYRSVRCVQSKEQICPTLSTMQGGLREPKILEENKIMHIANTDDKFESNARVYSEDGLSPTLAARDYKDAKKVMIDNKSNYRVRKLTPLECWRLMGMSDERFNRVKNMGISDSQMYKLAGNSIIKNCLDSIFKELFKEYIVKY